MNSLTGREEFESVYRMTYNHTVCNIICWNNLVGSGSFRVFQNLLDGSSMNNFVGSGSFRVFAESQFCSLFQNLLDGGAMNNLIGGLAGGGHRAAANAQPNAAAEDAPAEEEGEGVAADNAEQDNDGIMEGGNNAGTAAQGAELLVAAPGGEGLKEDGRGE